MNGKKLIWTGLAFLNGALMALITLAFLTGAGGVFLRKIQMEVWENKPVPFIAWVGVVVILSAVGTSVSLLFGTIAIHIGRVRTGSRSLILGSIFQWLFSLSGLLFHWDRAANRSIHDISPLMMIFVVIAVFVSIAAYKVSPRSHDPLAPVS